jgi:hypothetical protein
LKRELADESLNYFEFGVASVRIIQVGFLQQKQKSLKPFFTGSTAFTGTAR